MQLDNVVEMCMVNEHEEVRLTSLSWEFLENDATALRDELLDTDLVRGSDECVLLVVDAW